MPPMRSVFAIWLIIFGCLLGSLQAAEELEEQPDNIALSNQTTQQGAEQIGPETAPGQSAIVASQEAASDVDPSSQISQQAADEKSKRDATNNFLEKWDVIAQWVMAVAAIVLLFIGLGQLYLSYWGIGLLKDTLHETRVASNAAMLGAAATKTAADAAMIQAQQSRAWLMCNIKGPKFTKVQHIPGFEYSIDLRIENSGTSPAMECVVRAAGGYLPSEPQGEIPLGNIKTEYIGLIAPGGSAPYGYAFTKTRLVEIAGAQNSLYVRVVVEYLTPGVEGIRITDETFKLNVLNADANLIQRILDESAPEVASLITRMGERSRMT